MAGELDSNTVAKAYAGWAPIYDVVFGAVFAPGRAAAVRAAERVGRGPRTHHACCAARFGHPHDGAHVPWILNVHGDNDEGTRTAV